jgi:hypothetical protein
MKDFLIDAVKAFVWLFVAGNLLNIALNLWIEK